MREFITFIVALGGGMLFSWGAIMIAVWWDKRRRATR